MERSIAVFCETPTVYLGLEKAVRVAIDARWFDIWSQFEKAARGMATGLVIIPQLTKSQHFSDLVELVRTYPNIPTLLVTDTDFGNAKELRHLPVTDVLPSNVEPALLLDTIKRMISDAPFASIVARIRKAIHLPTTVRAACLRAWMDTPFPQTVEGLSRSVGASRRTFYTHWGAAFDGKPPYDPKVFLDWTLLLRSVRLRTAGSAWKRIERDLQVYRSTIMRMSDRIAGGRQGGSASDAPALLEQFESEVLLPLLVRPGTR